MRQAEAGGEVAQYNDFALLHEGFYGVSGGFGQKVGAAYANGSNGRIEAITFGLHARCLPGDLANGTAHQFQIEVVVDAGRIDLVLLDQQFGVGAQRDAALVHKYNDGNGIATGNNTVTFGNEGAQTERCSLAFDIDALGLTH